MKDTVECRHKKSADCGIIAVASSANLTRKLESDKG